jgi:hypothetical protein
MTDYKQLYEQMKEKQTTTFAMMMKVMEENEALKEENKHLEEKVHNIGIMGLQGFLKKDKEIKELNEELQEEIIKAEKYEVECFHLKENIKGLEEMLDA